MITIERQEHEAQKGHVGEDVKKLQKLKEDFAAAEQARAPFEGTWLLNMAFFEGEQWLTWDGNRLSKPKLSSNRILITDNRIQPAVRTEIAKMTKSLPAWDATPDSSSDDAVEGARISERAMDSKWETMELQDKLFDALQWSRVCSDGFWKVTWDKSLGKGREVLVGEDGKVARDQETEKPLPVEMLEQMPPEMRGMVPLTRQRVHQGDARIDVRSPFQVYPDPLAENMHDCERFWEKNIVDPVYLKGLYGVDMQPDSEAMGGLVQARLSRPGRSGKTPTQKRGVIVYEFWQKGNAVDPNGRHVVWAQDKILLDEANPYVDEEDKSVLPYVRFPGIGVPGRFWSTTIVEQLRPLQVELNKVKSQKAENRNRFGNPSLLVSKQANVEYYGVPGEKVKYDDTTQNAVPSFLSPPEMPNYVQMEVAEMLEAIRDVSGQHEISSGTVPNGVTAAAAISLLQQQDDTKLGPPTHQMEKAISRAGQMLLRLIATFYTDERLVRLSGEDGKFRAFQFKGAMLAGQANGIRVTPGSMMPKSKSAKQAAMSDMFGLMIQYGARFDDRALRKFFRQFEAGGLEALLGDLGADEQKVNRENRQMYNGETVEVNQIVDNHEAEIAGHREEMKGPEYAAAAAANPNVQAAFMAHLQAHIDAVAPPPAPEMVDPNAEEEDTDLMAQLGASAEAGGTLPNVSVTPSGSEGSNAAVL